MAIVKETIKHPEASAKTIALRDHPELEVASKLTSLINGAVIAGGYPRDLLLDRPYKDIDIFVPTLNHPAAAAQKTFEIATAAHSLGIDLQPEEAEHYSGVFSRWSHGALDILLVPVFYSGAELVDRFDIELCKAWLAPARDDFDIVVTPGFVLHAKHKVFGYRIDQSNFSRIHRLMKEFDDYLPVEMAAKPECLGSAFAQDIAF